MNGTLKATRKNEAELFLWVWKDTHECKEDITVLRAQTPEPDCLMEF